MRLILAKIIWSFEIKAADENFDWVAACKSFVTWEKVELKVHFIPRVEPQMEYTGHSL